MTEAQSGGKYIAPNRPFIEADILIHYFKQMPGMFSWEDVPFRHYNGESLDEKKLLVMRRGGYGDLLFTTPLIRELKRKYPTCKIAVACNPKHHIVFVRNPDVDGLGGYPMPLDEFEQFDFHLTFEGTIEQSATPENAYDVFAKCAGITLPEDNRLPIYYPEVGSGNMTRMFLRRLGVGPGKKVMIQMGASAPWRSWSPRYAIATASTLGRAGIQVFLVGSAKDFPYIIPPMKNVYQLCTKMRNGIPEPENYWPIENTVALMNRMDLFIGPDSGLTHFAAALGIPQIAIYGPFPSESRVKYYPKCFVFEDREACSEAPCYRHHNRPCPHMSREDLSPCMHSITPERVIAKVGEVLGLSLDLPITTVNINLVEHPKPERMQMPRPYMSALAIGAINGMLNPHQCFGRPR